MIPASMKICALLLWGVSGLFPAESVTSSGPENSNINFSVATDSTTIHQSTVYVRVSEPATPHPAKPADVTAHTTEAAPPTAVHENGVGNKTSSPDNRQVGLTAAAAEISSSKPLTPTEKMTTKDVVPVKTRVATEQSFTAGLTSTGGLQSVSPTFTAGRGEQPFTGTSGEANSSAVVNTTADKQVTSPTTTGDAQTFTEVTSTGGGLQPSTAMTTSTTEVQPANQTTERVKQTKVDFLYTSAPSLTETAVPETGSAALNGSMQHSTSVPAFRSEVPTTTSVDELTQSASTFSGPTTSVPTSGTAQSTSANLSSPSHSDPVPTTFRITSIDPASTSTQSSNTTTANSSSPAGVLIPRAPASTTRLAPTTTTAPCKPSKSSTHSEALNCSSKGVVKKCLVVIGVLALVATIFIVSTIVLCIKLSGRKYKVRKPQQATEMMCISSLLPDRSHTYTRQRNPVSNGVLVFPGGGDSDEEGGDNLTLSSFLPENDRYV